MYRKDLITLLLENPMSVAQIAEQEQIKLKDVADDLRHLFKSVKHQNLKVDITPAVCEACGFRFKQDKILKPSRCPLCKSKSVSEPLIAFYPNK